MSDQVTLAPLSEQARLDGDTSGNRQSAELRAELEKHILAERPPKSDALYQSATHHFARQGKLLRGLLAMNIARQLGAPIAASLKWALAIELMHNASLVHDDICDGDELRRGQPAIWSRFGTPVALCLGDWLLARSFALASEAGAAANAPNVVAILATTMTDLSSGQAMEFTSSAYPNWDRYQAIVLGKTTPLLRACVEGALCLAHASVTADGGNFNDMLRSLGLAYQMANDIEDIMATDGSGRDQGDLIRAAPNAVIIAFRASLRPARLAAFDRWLKKPDADSLQFWRSAILASGALGSTSDHIQILIDQADMQLQGLHPDLQPHLRPIFNYLTAACTQAIAAGRLLEAAQ